MVGKGFAPPDKNAVRSGTTLYWKAGRRAEADVESA